MSVISVILILAAIGFIMWLLNTYAAPYIAPSWVKLINIVAIIFTIIWLIGIIFPSLWGSANTVKIQPIR